MATLPLIPAPVAVTNASGTFIVPNGATLIVSSGDPAALRVANYFTEHTAQLPGLRLHVDQSGANARNPAIRFVLDPRLPLPGKQADEAYHLKITSRGIRLAARTPHGLFNGAVTLWQLLSAQPASTRNVAVPCIDIADYPRFAWRGLMLDSVRHFQSPPFIKRLLDQMALHKLNIFHWHLTDDQGWRVPIPQYPLLTGIGAWRTPTSLHGKAARYGGFYTHDQIRDIVRYAAARYITVVPEIEMPGHAQAAIASYPQFGVTGKRPPVSHDWGVHTWLFNVDDATFDFLDTVLSDVMRLFPGPYIHVGGDEAAKDQWQASPAVQRRMRKLGIADEAKLQGWFTARIGKFLDAHGRRLIGWDEILDGGVPPDAIVMSWRGAKGAVAAAQQGHDVIMAPSPTLYFDHIQSRRYDEPPGRAGVESLADVYAYDPLPKSLTQEQAAHVLGAQGNLWSEYLDTDARVEHAAFPRLDALAEVLWSPPSRRNWHDFLTRLPAQLARYRAAGIDFADSAFAVDIDAKRHGPGAVVSLDNQAHFGTIRYTLDGLTPTPASPVYTAPLHLTMPVTLRATAFAPGGRLAAPRQQRIDALSLLRRNSDQLGSCEPPGQGLELRLPGPSVSGGETVYDVDIFDPCWIYPAVDLDRIGRIEVDAARVPYYFQLWKDASKVVLRKPAIAGGELQVHQDSCAGPLLTRVPLALAVRSDDTARLTAPLRGGHGTHALCLTFARARISPMWLLDSVQLLPAGATRAH